MHGTEKQIKWAGDIVEAWKKQAQRFADFLAMTEKGPAYYEAEQYFYTFWGYVGGTAPEFELEKVLSVLDSMTDAAKIINNRAKTVGEIYCRVTGWKPPVDENYDPSNLGTL